MSVSLTVCLSAYLPPCLLSVCLSVCLVWSRLVWSGLVWSGLGWSVFLSVCLSVSSSLCLPVSLSPCLPVSPSLSLSLSLSLSIYLRGFCSSNPWERSGVDNMATAGLMAEKGSCWTCWALLVTNSSTRLGVPYKWDHLENVGDVQS